MLTGEVLLPRKLGNEVLIIMTLVVSVKNRFTFRGVLRYQVHDIEC